MSRLPSDISFEQWVAYVFDHPIRDPQWWFQGLPEAENGRWNEDAKPILTLAHLMRLFSAPAFLMSRFTRAQIDQGLNFLVSNGCSNHMLVLTNTDLPWKDRCGCIEAMYILYRDLMAPLYGNDLEHLRTGKEDPEHPNFSCYMWWDVIPLSPAEGGADAPERDRTNEAVLCVFQKTLTLRSEACLESVLHGLGHWHAEMPERTTLMVRDFLISRRDISSSLRRYAEQAAIGDVL